MMNKTQIEPGLLSLFRLFIALWLLYSGGDVIGSVFGWNLFTLWHLFGAVIAAIMVVYAYVGRLQYLMGRWYLLVGISTIAVGGIVAQGIEIAWRIEGNKPLDVITNGEVSLSVLLFVPAMLITVQYSYRTMLGFVVGTAVLQLLVMLTLILVYEDWSVFRSIMGDATGRAFVYLLVGFLVVRLVSGQKEERRTLAAKNVQLTQYATTVERLAISHERNRLARELHDTLAHTLSAVAVQVEALNKQLERDPDDAKQTVQQLRKLTRSGLQESRRALQALRASPLEDLGLVLAMRQLVEATAERSGIEITLDMPEELVELPPEVEQGIYRITEEALNNTARHAGAQNVSVLLRNERAELRLTITDDGVGFDPEKVETNGHYGLVGMHERALLCSGQLEILSSPAVGTTVQLTVGV